MASIDFDADGFVADLDDAIDELDDIEDRWTGTREWIVGTNVNYAIFLEYGTSDMDPRPFFRPAIGELNRSLETFIASNTSTTLEAIDSVSELVRVVALALERRVKEIITQKGLIQTGTLRASIAAIPGADVGALPTADDIDFDDETGEAIDFGAAARSSIEVNA